MTSEVTKTAPANAEKEKETKEDAPVDNGQKKEEAAINDKEKSDDKNEEKKAEPAAPKLTVHKLNFEKDVVYLYQLSRTPLLPSTSPYCLKVETWLRVAGIKYENVEHKAKFRSKKGQLPFVELNGEEIADSTFIIRELSARFGKDLDQGLTAEQRVLAHALTSMLENHFSWVVLWWRAKYPESVIKGYQLNLQEALNTRVPTAILNLCYKFTSARKGMKKARAHGIGLHSEEVILSLGRDDLRVLSDLLADKPYFFGDEPTTLDVVAFSQVAQLQYLSSEVDHPLRTSLANDFSNLVGMLSRMQARAFPDWEEVCVPPPTVATAAADNKEQEKPVAEDAEKVKGAEKENKEAEGEKEKEAEAEAELDDEK